jgi:hypothetical protein
MSWCRAALSGRPGRFFPRSLRRRTRGTTTCDPRPGRPPPRGSSRSPPRPRCLRLLRRRLQSPGRSLQEGAQLPWRYRATTNEVGGRSSHFRVEPSGGRPWEVPDAGFFDEGGEGAQATVPLCGRQRQKRLISELGSVRSDASVHAPHPDPHRIHVVRFTTRLYSALPFHVADAEPP